MGTVDSTEYQKHGFIKVAAVSPRLFLGNIRENVEEISTAAHKVSKAGAVVAVFPELSLTGYTLGDLFFDAGLPSRVEAGLAELCVKTAVCRTLLIVGAPIAVNNHLFNCAVVIERGNILGVYPKTYLPNNREFYEKRWFLSARGLQQKTVRLCGKEIPIGTDLLFHSSLTPALKVGIEICEDLWAVIPPSSNHVLSGATVIANLSASNELVGKSDYRKKLIENQSGRGICAYVYASAGAQESTMDTVFGGDCIIAENGTTLSEGQLFSQETEISYADVDLEHLMVDRRINNNFAEDTKDYRVIVFAGNTPAPGFIAFERTIDPQPFLPKSFDDSGTPDDGRCEEVFAIQTAGLVKRWKSSLVENLVIGVSGGLDSTLALLVAVRACKERQLPLTRIIGITMPGMATTNNTKSNAVKLMEQLGITVKEIPISNGAKGLLLDVNHTGKQDRTYENAQARYRTLVLMTVANDNNGLVVGTGDLSEIALGWCTFNGDHISNYNVNCGVPKTLVRYVIRYAMSIADVHTQATIERILDTPISPELTGDGTGVSQKTEDIVGPYELHDFFLYHTVRWFSTPEKIRFLASVAFGSRVPINPTYHAPDRIDKWLALFVKRFRQNQWKRSVAADGPKVGSVSLSPRSDWRVPSDIV